MKLQLRIESGTLSGRTFDLETGFLTIGRSETCSVRFDPLSERIASKQHAFIEARADGFYLTDNNSTNGTLLNGQKIDAARLSSGDRIQFGTNGTTASIHIEGQPIAADAPIAAAQQIQREREMEQFNQTIANEPPVNLQASIQNFALGSISTVKPEPPKTGRYIGVVITIFGIIFLSLVVILLMIVNVGIVPAVIAAIVAFLPATLYVLPLVWLDRYDPEPSWLLSLAFAWGALVAVIVSFIVNTLVSIVVSIGVSPAAGSVVGAVMSAPIFEEGSKGLGLVILLIFFRKYFDDILDGLVFAGVIALGFATVENVLYYGRQIAEFLQSQPGIERDIAFRGLILIFVLRGILSPFAHVTFTSMTGIGCGIARESHKTAVRLLMPIVGYIGAVSLHAIWNGLAVVGGLGGFAVGYLVLEVPFFAIFVGFSLYIMHRQNKILKEMLAIDIARGLIPQEHAKIATSAFSSSFWVLGGLFSGKFRPRTKYVRALGKLGLSYWHIQRATAAQGQTGSFQQNPILREEVLRWRDQV